MEARFSLFRYFPFPFPVSESLLRFKGIKIFVAFWGGQKFLLRLRGVEKKPLRFGGVKIFPCVPRGLFFLLRSRGVKLSLASMGDYSALLPLIANHGGYFF